MPYIAYPKPYRSPAELIQDLKRKNLSFLDEREAEKLLGQISYYRFKIYLYPFIDPANSKKYIDDALFESGVALYRFDEQLRASLFAMIARLEVKLRSRLDHTLASHSQDPFWYLDDRWFTRSPDHLRQRISSEFMRNRSDYAAHYKSRYFNERHDNYKSLPPFWIISELLSLGVIREIYDAINAGYFHKLPGKAGNLLSNLASEFGASGWRDLATWLQVLRDVRNRCAHHSRLWNVNLPEPRGIAHLTSITSGRSNRLYGALVVIHQMLVAQNINDVSLINTLLALSDKYPRVEAQLLAAGFPKGWYKDPFWH